MSLLLTAIRTTMHRFRRPAWLCNQKKCLVSGLQFSMGHRNQEIWLAKLRIHSQLKKYKIKWHMEYWYYNQAAWTQLWKCCPLRNPRNSVGGAWCINIHATHRGLFIIQISIHLKLYLQNRFRVGAETTKSNKSITKKLHLMCL